MSSSNGPIAYHLVPAAAWEAAAPDGSFSAASLADEGFVHLTHSPDDLVEVANAFYRTDPGPHLVLTVELDRLSAPWRYDGDRRYPHVYGPLDRDAIVDVRPIRRAPDGTFLPLDEPRPEERPDERPEPRP